MGKKKHNRKNKEIYPFIPVGILPDIQTTTLMEMEQRLSFEGGTVRTARVTSKGIPLLDGRKHHNNPVIQRYCGREVLIFEKGETVTAYLYEPMGPIFIRIMFVTLKHRSQAKADCGN